MFEVVTVEQPGGLWPLRVAYAVVDDQGTLFAWFVSKVRAQAACALFNQQG